MARGWMAIAAGMLALGVLAHGDVASAQDAWTSGISSTVGNSMYYSFDNGVTGVSNRIGNNTYYNFSDGVSGHSSQIGNYTYHSHEDPAHGALADIVPHDREAISADRFLC